MLFVSIGYECLKMENSAPVSRVLYWHGCQRLPFIYSACRQTAPAFYPPSGLCSDGQPSADGLHELAAPRRHSTTVASRLVVSYTTFSPLPAQTIPLPAVVFFCRIPLSPTASIFGSGASCAARTFLSCLHQRQTGALLSVGKGTKKKANMHTFGKTFRRKT